MKVLVTGAAGFLGLAVVERLLAHGYTDIRCNIRRRSQIPKLDAIAKHFPGGHPGILCRQSQVSAGRGQSR